jgi:hypothetical protein
MSNMPNSGIPLIFKQVRLDYCSISSSLYSRESMRLWRWSITSEWIASTRQLRMGWCFKNLSINNFKEFSFLETVSRNSTISNALLDSSSLTTLWRLAADSRVIGTLWQATTSWLCFLTRWYIPAPVFTPCHPGRKRGITSVMI